MQDRLGSHKLTQKNIDKFKKILKQNNLPNFVFIQGFLTAIASGPNLIQPPAWMNYLGFDHPFFSSKSLDELEYIVDMLLSAYNHICSRFDAGKFKVPLSDASPLTQKKQWAKGYMEAINWHSDDWLIEDDHGDIVMMIDQATLNRTQRLDYERRNRSVQDGKAKSETVYGRI